MATTQLSLQILRPLPAASQTCGRQSYGFQSRNSAIRTRKNLKWALRQSLVDQNQPQSQSRGVDVKQLVDFLYDDLPHLFDDQGIDRTAYDERVKFRDPITKHDSIRGYLFNIALLKNLFRPQFFLHWVKQVCSSNNNNCLLEFLLFFFLQSHTMKTALWNCSKDPKTCFSRSTLVLLSLISYQALFCRKTTH